MVSRKKDNWSLQEALKHFIEEHQLEPGITQVRVVELWHQLMGQGVSTYTTGVELKGDTLYISLSSSVLRQELLIGREKILKMLNEALGSDQIKKIVLR